MRPLGQGLMQPPSSISSLTWLVFAALLLPFSNGENTIPVATWLAPIFLLRFVRMQKVTVALPLVYLLHVLPNLYQFHGAVQLVGIAYYFFLALMGIPLSLPYVVDRLVKPRLQGFVTTLVFPTTWVVVDYFLSKGPYASNGSIAYSQYGNLPLLQMLSLTGIWGITFLIGWVAAVGNWVWEEGLNAKSTRLGTGFCVMTLVLVTFLGGARMALFPPSASSVRIASLSQTEIQPTPTEEIWARVFENKSSVAEVESIRRWEAAVNADLLARSEREAQAGAKIVFWAEETAPVLKEDEASLVERGAALAAKYQIYLGMALATLNRGQALPLENKIVLIQPSGQVAWEYYKAHPVPEDAAISLTKDDKLRSLDTPYGRLSSVICFDADFPQFVAQAGKIRTDILLDPSLDWRAIDPMHTYTASFRAIEQGLNLVRQTDHGLSAAFDYQGRPLASADHFQTVDHVMISQVPTQGVRTVYSRLGDWFAWVSLAALLLLCRQSFRPRI